MFLLRGNIAPIWLVDKFRALLVRFDSKEVNFLAGHHLAFALINLRHLFAANV
jgi:hypothetical protein